MAGSLNHIVNDDGSLNLDLVETYGDKDGALIECHQVIAELLEMLTLVQHNGTVHGVSASDKAAVLSKACDRLGFPVPKAVPVIDPALGGAESVYKPEEPKDWLLWSTRHRMWRCSQTKHSDDIGDATRYTLAGAIALESDTTMRIRAPGAE